MKDIHELIIAHLNDESSTDEIKRLFEWICENPENANEFARYALMHAQLRGQYCGEKLARESGEVATLASTSPKTTSAARPSQTPGTKQKFRRRNSLVLCGSIVVGLLMVAYTLFLWPPKNQPGTSPRQVQGAFAVIVQTVDAEWGDGRHVKKGDRTSTETIDLLSGFVRLVLDSGVEVSLQGPARLELVTVDRLKLTSGLLTATVPPGAIGFRIEVPNAEITDQGTAFGIQLDNNGVSRISVFDGQVDVALRNSQKKLSLKESESALVKSELELETVRFDSAPFQKLWPISSGIERSTGAFRFAPPWPRRLRFVRSDNEIFVVPEGYSTTLSEPLNVNIASPGKYIRAENLTNFVIPTGRTVRSFLLHFHPDHNGVRRRFTRTVGSITFDRPVVGLIVLHKELAASSTRFPGRKAGESLEHRQLELTGNRVGDVVTLSEDRRTVSLDLAAPTRFSDLVRVIVDASTEHSAANQ